MPRMNKDGTRDYSYDKQYQKGPAQKAKKQVRNADRYAAKKAGRVKPGDGKDVHHVGGARPGAKTRVISASRNRSMK
jgi:hypothetical protein